MFPGPASYILAQERVASERREFNREIEAMYRRPDALPDGPGASADASSAGRVGVLLAGLIRQIVARRQADAPR
jgi:hypothetical protein